MALQRANVFYPMVHTQDRGGTEPMVSEYPSKLLNLISDKRGSLRPRKGSEKKAEISTDLGSTKSLANLNLGGTNYFIADGYASSFRQSDIASSTVENVELYDTSLSASFSHYEKQKYTAFDAVVDTASQVYFLDYFETEDFFYFSIIYNGTNSPDSITYAVDRRTKTVYPSSEEADYAVKMAGHPDGAIVFRKTQVGGISYSFFNESTLTWTTGTIPIGGGGAGTTALTYAPQNVNANGRSSWDVIRVTGYNYIIAYTERTGGNDAPVAANITIPSTGPYTTVTVNGEYAPGGPGGAISIPVHLTFFENADTTYTYFTYVSAANTVKVDALTTSSMASASSITYSESSAPVRLFVSPGSSAGNKSVLWYECSASASASTGRTFIRFTSFTDNGSGTLTKTANSTGTIDYCHLVGQFASDAYVADGSPSRAIIAFKGGLSYLTTPTSQEKTYFDPLYMQVEVGYNNTGADVKWYLNSHFLRGEAGWNFDRAQTAAVSGYDIDSLHLISRYTSASTSDDAKEYFRAGDRGAVIRSGPDWVGTIGIFATRDLDVQYDSGPIVYDGQIVTQGGAPHIFDGQRFWHGWLSYPLNVRASLGSGGSGTWSDWNAATDEVIVQAVYEYRDSLGKVHRSEPSLLTIVTLDASNKKITVRVGTPVLQDMFTASVVIYRSEVNDTALYEAGRITVTSASAETVTFDLVGDADSILTKTDDGIVVANKGTLYTDQGVFRASELLPPHTCSCIHLGRLFMGNQRSLTYTGPAIDGVGPWYSSSFSVAIGESGGDIIGLASMDEKLIVFRESAVQVVSGSPTDLSASQYLFQAPRVISPGVGCNSPRSIAVTPVGCFYGSKSGIRMIGRDESDQFVGEVMRYYRGATIYGTHVDQSQNLVHFFTDTVTLVFDWEKRMWFEWDGVYGAVRGVSLDRSGDLLIVNGTSPNYGVHIVPGGFDERYGNTDTRGNDNLVPFRKEVITGWMSFADVGGYMRTYKAMLIGYGFNATSIKVEAGFDFEPYFYPASTYDLTQIVNPSAEYPFDILIDGTDDASYIDQACIVEVALPRQKCTSIRLKIYQESPESVNVGDGEYDYSLTGICFEIGKKRGMFKPGSNREF